MHMLIDVLVLCIAADKHFGKTNMVLSVYG